MGFSAVLILVILIQTKFFPRKADSTAKPLSFWKLMGLVMGIVFALLLLAYAALWIYVTFILTRTA
ncbi:hypothetical protein C7T94_07815 [Pedobacter yulinensis]|uniref:Uncharacterized protein n=1 Tax=Pedobacter yulinensis TaxID=2126353 RepID=A0A2T3HJE0_9SPHI|nr:hypothetical protein C7T94_07815 [Pedobacter yulinensis]